MENCPKKTDTYACCESESISHLVGLPVFFGHLLPDGDVLEILIVLHLCRLVEVLPNILYNQLVQPLEICYFIVERLCEAKLVFTAQNVCNLFSLLFDLDVAWVTDCKRRTR